MKVSLIYTSVTGNVRSFVTRLSLELCSDYEVKVIEYNESDCLYDIEDNPTIAIVPTYMDGDNGNSGETEIMTDHLKELLEYNENNSKLMGVIGSGNKNFNWQYCLTAKQYAKDFNVPMIGDFELRGTDEDIENIAVSIREIVDINQGGYYGS